MIKFGIGQAVTRFEDQRLITGQGRYTDDLAISHAARAYILRSPHANARIQYIDTAAAQSSAGVLLILTGADVEADGLGDNPCMIPIHNRDGTQRPDTPWPILAKQQVRYVGDPVALIIAETLEQARDATELIEIDYEPLPAAVDTVGATKADQLLVWPDIANNVVFDWQAGDQEAVDQVFAEAAHISEVRIINNRIIANSMETRTMAVDYDADTERSTLYSSTQGPAFIQAPLAEQILKIDPAQLRCVTTDVGGGFGMKVFVYPEHALVTWASRKLKRAVRYTPERSDAFVSDVHGRDNVSYAQVATDEQGVMQALRVTTYANMGAYLSNFAPFIPTDCGTNMLSGCYRLPHIYVNVKGVMTHTTPVDAYRGAGRPEATYLIERVIDVLGRDLGLSQDEIRRRNFIAPQQMPFKTALGNTYDSGDFASVMDQAMAAADWQGFEQRRHDAKSRGKLRGIGLATYIERCGGGTPLPARVRFNDDETITILSGTQSNGQGHETAFIQILCEHLGVAPEQVSVVQGDTDITPSGFTGGSRSVPVGGVAVAGAAQEVIEKGRQVAAQALEVASADIEFAAGSFNIVGTDRRMSLFEVARAAKQPENVPVGMSPGLDIEHAFTPPEATYPNGCHVCEVEIDVSTGAASIERYTVIDDFGATINPLLLAGQVHGGIAQGMGQAMYEQGQYDADGQLLTGSFMDYAMPRADTVPEIHFNMQNIPCATNPLGIKGAGEAGAIGAPPAVVSAFVDALNPITGITHIDMPITAEAVWSLLRQPS